MYFPLLRPTLLNSYNFPHENAKKNRLYFFKPSRQVVFELYILKKGINFNFSLLNVNNFSICPKQAKIIVDELSKANELHYYYKVRGFYSKIS